MTLIELHDRLRAVNARLAELRKQRSEIHAEEMSLQTEGDRLCRKIEESLGDEQIEIGLPPKFTPD